MIDFNKIKFGLNLLVIAPLAAGIAVISTSVSTVQAQTMNNSVEASAQLPENNLQFSISSTQIPAAAFLDASQYQTAFPEHNNSAAVTNNPLPSSQTVAANQENLDQLQQTAPALEQNATPAPIPGTTATNANNLSKQPSIVNQSEQLTDSSEVAQLPVAPGRRTRSGSSYVGIGVNVGLSGDTALGDGNLMIISKIGLTNSLALRPGVILGDDPIILLPVTYEFSIRRTEALEEALRIAPYIGAGVTISTAEDDDIGLLLTGGIDVPLSSQFTANAGLNVGIASETDIGLSVGVGYNFGGFGL
ncbi:MAG: hypothetical protein H0U45_08960 [Tatlockia sp.]|nr:hypothetical protein [Tatlockia sp.]